MQRAIYRFGPAVSQGRDRDPSGRKRIPASDYPSGGISGGRPKDAEPILSRSIDRPCAGRRIQTGETDESERPEGAV